MLRLNGFKRINNKCRHFRYLILYMDKAKEDKIISKMVYLDPFKSSLKSNMETKGRARKISKLIFT